MIKKYEKIIKKNNMIFAILLILSFPINGWANQSTPGIVEPSTEGLSCSEDRVRALGYIASIASSVQSCATDAAETIGNMLGGSTGSSNGQITCASSVGILKGLLVSADQAGLFNPRTLAAIRRTHREADALIAGINNARAGERVIRGTIIRRTPRLSPVGRTFIRNAPRGVTGFLSAARRAHNLTNPTNILFFAGAVGILANMGDAAEQGFTGSCEASPFPLTYGDDGTCSINLAMTAQIQTALQNEDLLAQTAREHPAVCSYLEEMISSMVNMANHLVPGMSSMSLRGDIQCVAPGYSYSLSVETGGETSHLRVTRNPEAGTLVISDDITHRVLPISPLTITFNEDNQIGNFTYENAEGAQSVNRAELLSSNVDAEISGTFTIAESVRILNENFFGAAVRHCCQSGNGATNSCLRLGFQNEAPTPEGEPTPETSQ